MLVEIARKGVTTEAAVIEDGDRSTFLLLPMSAKAYSTIGQGSLFYGQ